MAKDVIGEPKWVEKRKHWRLPIQKDGERKEFYSSNPSRKMGPAECRKKAKTWLDSLDLVSNIYFVEAWEEYLDYYGKKYKITSLEQIEGKGKAHLIPRFEHTKLAEISKVDWQNVILDAYENGAKSKLTLKSIAATIRSFCKWASTRGYLYDKDVPLYFAYPTEKTGRKKQVLQPEEFAALLSDTEDDSNWYINCFRFLALTGLRRGELCALQLKRDYFGDYIVIRESISHKGYVTDGKTADAQRSVYLGDLAKEAIHKHELQLLASGRRNRMYLFCNPAGQRISPRVLRGNWEKWRSKHGLIITLHELRHTYITYSSQTDISLDDLKETYGHSANMDTDKVYVHAIKESAAEAQARIKAGRDNAQKIDHAILSHIGV